MLNRISKIALLLFIVILGFSIAAISIGNSITLEQISSSSNYIPEWFGYHPISETQTCLLLRRNGKSILRCQEILFPEGIFGWIENTDYHPCDVYKDGLSDCTISWNWEYYGRVFTCNAWTGILDGLLYFVTSCPGHADIPVIFTYPLGPLMGS